MNLFAVISSMSPPPPSGGTEATFGEETIGIDDFPCSDGRCLVSAFTPANAGDLIHIRMHFSAATTAGCSAKMVILDSSGGEPNNVIGVSAGIAIPAGASWVEAAIAVPITVQEYFIGSVTNSFEAKWSKRDGSLGTAKMANGTFDYASPPATWPGTTANYGGQVCAFGTYEY